MAEAPTMEVRARLTAETAQFTRGFQQATQATENFSKTASRLTSAMTGIGVAAGAIGASMIALGLQSFRAAARVDELDIAMNAVGKSTGLGYAAIREATLAIKDNGIEMDIAQKAALKFAQNQINLTQASELARVAQDLAVISGMNSSETFNMLTHAVITGRSEVLKSVGIQKSAGQMYESFAKSIGKTAAQLTHTEKQTAVLTGALAEGAKVAGTYEAAMTSPGKVLRSFARVQNEILVSMGNVLLAGFGPLIFSAYNFVKAMAKASEESKTVQTVLEAIKMVLTKLTAPIVVAIDKITEFVKGLDKVAGSADEARAKATNLINPVKSLAENFEMLLPVLAAATAGFATFAGNKLLTNLPVIGKLLGFLKPLPVAMVVLALTSTQVRNALVNLLSAFKPLLPAVQQIGKIMATASVIGVAVLAKALNILAAVVRGVIGFVQRNIAVFKILGMVIAGVALVVGGYLAVIGLMTAATVIWGAVTTATTTLIKGLRMAMLLLNIAMIATPIPLLIGLFVALLGAFGYLINTNEDFRETFGKVFNFVAELTVKVFAFLAKAISHILDAFASYIRVLGFFAEIYAKVFEFVMDVVLTFGQFFLRMAKTVIDGFIYLQDITKNFGNVTLKVFEFVIDVVLTFAQFFLKMAKNIIDGFIYIQDTMFNFGNVTVKVFEFVIDVILTFAQFFLKMAKNVIDGFIYLQDITNNFGNVTVKVFEFVIDVILTFAQFFLKSAKLIIDGFISLMETNSTFAQVVENVFNFVVKSILMAVRFIVGLFKSWIDFYINVFDSQNLLYKVVVSVFNGIIKVIGFVISSIINVFAELVSGVGTLVNTFNRLFNVVKSVFLAMVSAIEQAGLGIFGLLNSIANGVGKFLGWVFDSMTAWLRGLATLFSKIPKIGDDIAKAINGGLDATKKVVTKFASGMVGLGETMFEGILTGTTKLVNGVATIGVKTKEALDDTEKTLRDFSAKVSEFSDKDVGQKLIDGLIAGGKATSETLGTVIDAIKDAEKIEFGKAVSDGLVKGASVASVALGFLIDNMDKVKSFDMARSVGDFLTNVAEKASSSLETVIDGIQKVKDFDMARTVGDFLTNTAEKASSAIGTVIDGIEKVKDFDMARTVGNFLTDAAEKASSAISVVIDGMEKVKDFDMARTVGDFIDGIASKVDKAGEFVLGLSATMFEFAENTDFAGAIGTKIGDFIEKVKESLKEGLGFGDILKEEKKKYEEASKIDDGTQAAEDAEKMANRLKVIRDAMRMGIESIKGVLDDLQQAAKDFADSLKDTIVGFAGLKSIELPDGFIPKAKSLITNMEQRLNKSKEFAGQIYKLQSMGLDADALKSIIEEGPIKGAQIAASILGGGQSAIDEISRLQKEIQFTGAVIGEYGARVGFDQKIATASSQLRDLQNAETRVPTSNANSTFIQQGAFQVFVDTRGAADEEERASIITREIEKTFATLARQLASK